MNYCINFSLSEIDFFGFKIKEIFRKKSFKTLLITVLFLLTTNIFSQTGRVIQGKVFDSEGIALPGTNVVEGNSDNGVSTDFDGNFIITLENDDSSLVFSFLGFLTQEIKVGDQTELTIALESDASGLDEIVVTGYGSVKKINLTGSVATIKSEEITKIPDSNVAGALTGRAPGLFTKASVGIPGKDVPQISIRGYGAPLVLVDGVQADWTRMDPNEIESMSILKDAAAAVYGARAGNGVILITTKRGSEGPPSISLSSNITFQTPSIRPNFTSSWDYAELTREAELNEQLPYTYTVEDVEKFRAQNDPDYPNTDWYDAAFRANAIMQTHSLNVSGGSENVKYYLNAGYLEQGGLYKSDDLQFKRYNFRSNIDAKINDRLKVSVDLSYRDESSKEPNSEGLDITSLDQTWISLQTAVPVWSAFHPDPSKTAYSGFLARTPVGSSTSALTGSENDSSRYFFGRIGFEYLIPGIDGLMLKGDINYNSNDTHEKNHDRPYQVFMYSHETQAYSGMAFAGENNLYEYTTRYNMLYPVLSLNYEKEIGNHSFQGLVLAESIDTNMTSLSAGRLNLLSMDIPYLFAGEQEGMSNNSGAIQTGRMSYVGRVNYAFKNKYLFEATLRADGSFRFPTDSRWGYFPSFSAAWRLSEESFIEDSLSFVNSLKLRLSYSETGNDTVDPFRYVSGYQIWSDQYMPNYIFGDSLYRQIRTVGMPNPNITWLNNTNYNIGIDASLWNGLIGFEFDLFYRLTEGIFATPLDSYPSTFGGILPEENLNSTEDRGFELTINHGNQIGDDFTYQVNGSVSLARQKHRVFTEPNYDDPEEVRVYQKTGTYTNRWVGYKSNGIFMSQTEIDNHPIDQDQASNSTIRPGDIKYNDLNGDNVIDWKDQDQIGYGDFPDLTFGLNLQMSYKNFSVSAMFQGAGMFNYQVESTFAEPLKNNGNIMEFQKKYRWQPDPNNPSVNINPNAQLPALLGSAVGRNVNNAKMSDFWLLDSTFLRLRNLNFNYSIPKEINDFLGITSSSISLSGANLFTLNNMGIYKNDVDPEAPSTGGGRLAPINKTYSIGVNIKL